MVNNVIVILNYNDAHTTQNLVNQIKNYSNIDKIVVVDNCSTDDSLEILRQLESSKIDVIESKTNGGYAKGNNLGLFWAIDSYNPKYITIANPDVEFSEETLGKMLTFLAQNTDCGIVTAKVYKGYNAWHLPSYFETVLSLFVFSRWILKFGYRQFVIRKKKNPIECGVVEGSFFCARADLMKSINGYDERTFLYGEENILAHKIKDNGYKCVILPDSIYYHYHSISVNKSIHQKETIFDYKYDSYKLYCKEYLKIKKVQMWLFEIAYYFARFERRVYDYIKRVCR